MRGRKQGGIGGTGLHEKQKTCSPEKKERDSIQARETCSYLGKGVVEREIKKGRQRHGTPSGGEERRIKVQDCEQALGSGRGRKGKLGRHTGKGA